MFLLHIAIWIYVVKWSTNITLQWIIYGLIMVGYWLQLQLHQVHMLLITHLRFPSAMVWGYIIHYPLLPPLFFSSQILSCSAALLATCVTEILRTEHQQRNIPVQYSVPLLRIMRVPGSNCDLQASHPKSQNYLHSRTEGVFFKQMLDGDPQERYYVLKNCKIHIVTC
jgi:hypothetical protein